jgi:phage pi2 protein 07
MIRCRLTGNTSSIGNRDVSNEVRVYELVPELIPYSDDVIVFPSVREIERYFEKNIGKTPSVRSVLTNTIYQSVGYIFTREIILNTNPIIPIKKRKKIFQNIIVTKLVLVPYKIYDSIGWAKKDLFDIGRGKDEKRMSIQILDVIPNFSKEAKKIPFYTDDNGNRWMFVRTGRKTLVWPNSIKTADEIQSYKLEEEDIKYSNTQIEFPSEDEIFEKFQTIYSVIGCIKGTIFHSKGLRFKLK